jgi:2-polyprenyl-3-methyl-5-hydroxy-6-metoxy-1,4-benzoquinol methylase
MQTERPDDLTAGLHGPDLEVFAGWNEIGPVVLGPSASHAWRTDPRRFPITLSRYKHVAKLLAGKQRVLEIGCGDGFNGRIILQAVPTLHGVDVSEVQIAWAKANAARERLSATYAVTDVLAAPLTGSYDALVSLDVIEHIEPADEARFIRHLVAPLERDAVAVIGTPNIHAEAHGSRWSREGHINLKSAETLRASLEPFFTNVFIFSMNDEMLHTGFYPMAHYLIALCAGVRSTATTTP